MGLDFYSFPPSAGARMNLLLAKHLDLSLNITVLDLMKGEQLTPDFIAINPQHTVPTLVDDGFVLTESRAILMYLQNKYGKDESLYPKDPQKRAIVDMRIFFDVSTLYVRFADSIYPVMFQKMKPEATKLTKLDEALGFVETWLKDGYIAGSQLTIADFSAAAILSSMEACGIEMSKFQNITNYLEKCRSTMNGWNDVNQPGADAFGQWYKGALAALDG